MKIQMIKQCEVDASKLVQTSDGHFCRDCCKQVIDFTGMSDAQILDYTSKHGFGCGQFLEHQLDRELVPAQRKKSRLFIYITFLAMMFSKQPQVHAQPAPLTFQLPDSWKDSVLTRYKCQTEKIVTGTTVTRVFGGTAGITTVKKKVSWLRKILTIWKRERTAVFFIK